MVLVREQVSVPEWALEWGLVSVPESVPVRE